MRILITGGSGFVAPYMAEYVLSLKSKHKIFVVFRQQSNDGQFDRFPERLLRKINVVRCDLENAASVQRMMLKVRPDKIFHLAAHSFVKSSFDDPEECLKNNILVTLNLLEAARELKEKPIFHFAGSSEEYGYVLPRECPIKETNELRPLSPYGVSKVACEKLLYQYWMSYKIPVVLTRTFNHEGAGRGRQFFISNMCWQIIDAVKKGKSEFTIKVGNLNAIRDITHVEDVVRAYWYATESCKYGEVYNIGSGKSYRMKDILDEILRQAPIKVKVKVDKNRLRPSDVEVLICNYSKFRRRTGWKPKYTIKDVVRDNLEYWRTYES